MRDLRAVIHGITTAVLCGVAVFSCSTISKAAGETYQTADGVYLFYLLPDMLSCLYLIK